MYSFHDVTGDRTQTILRQPAAAPVDLAALVRSVQTDMLNTEKGGQWVISTYAPFKEKAAFPGFEDKSFEEIRAGYYEAVANGTVEQYKQQLQSYMQEASMKIRALQNPSQDIVNLLKQLYNTPVDTGGYSPNNNNMLPVVQPPPKPQPTPPTQSASIFSQSTPSTFGNQTIFGGSPQTQFNPPQQQPQQNLFGQQQPFQKPNNTPFLQQQPAFAQQQQQPLSFGAQQPFAQQPQPFIQPPQQPYTPPQQQQQPFVQPQQQQQPFVQPQPPTTQFPAFAPANPGFAQQPQQQTSASMFTPKPAAAFGNQPSIFSQVAKSIFAPTTETQFAQPQPPPPPQTTTFGSNQTPSIFGNNSNVFGNKVGDSARNDRLHTPRDALTPEELRSFQMEAFEMGKIPDRPPPADMCF